MLRNDKLDIFENFTTSRPNTIGGGFCDLTLEDIAEKMGKQSIQDIREGDND